MAKTSRKKGRPSVKEMRFRNDPMIRFYERAQDWLQERGRPIVIAIGIIAGLVVLYVAGHYYFRYRASKAAVAFSQALEKYNAQVLDPTQPAATTPTGKTYPDETTKWQDSAAAFEQLANDYSGDYGAMGRYYAGVAYLRLNNTDKGLGLLQQAADKNEQPTSDLARLAMAEYYATTGQTDKAIPLYKASLEASSALKPAIQVELARLYEKTGDTQSAVEAYFEVASGNRSAPAGQKAEERLKALAPDRMKDLPPPTDAPVIP